MWLYGDIHPRSLFSVLLPPAVAGVIPFCPRLFYFYPFWFPAFGVIPMARADFLKSKEILSALAYIGQHPIIFFVNSEIPFNGAALFYGTIYPNRAGSAEAAKKHLLFEKS